jgi:hypothetical protein
MAASAASVMIAIEKRIVTAFRQAGATSAGKAVSPKDIDVRQRLAFRRLVGHAVLRESGNGRFYLDEKKWESLRSLRRRVVFGILLFFGVAFLAFLAYFALHG